MSITMCPSSPPAPIQPRWSRPPSTSPPPIPVPSVSITTSPAPPPAPYRASASTAQLPSLSTADRQPEPLGHHRLERHVRERQVGGVGGGAGAPVERHGDAEADRRDLLVHGGARLLHRLDDRRHQARLIEPERLAPHAVAHGEIGPDDAREELGAAEVDPDDAARAGAGRRHGGCHHTHPGWPTRNARTSCTAAARGSCHRAKTTAGSRSCASPTRSRSRARRSPITRSSAAAACRACPSARRGSPASASRSPPAACSSGSRSRSSRGSAISAVLFMVSAQIQRGDLADEVGEQLDPGPYPLTGANTILVLGSDARTGGPRGARLGRAEPQRLDHAAADRRRRQRLALDPARHGRRHPRPRDEQDQRGVRVRRPRARHADGEGVPRRRDQPRRRGQLRELPAAHRRARRRDVQGRRRALADQRRQPQRRLHAAAAQGRDGDRRQAGARARPHAQEPPQPGRERPHARAPPAAARRRR